ncbi:MAG: Gldg family protein, partial [Planctomycetota bacterium]
MMNKNIVLAVAKRDLRSWFGNPTGYVFISLFVLLSVSALLLPGEFFRDNLATLDLLNRTFPWIAVLFTAAITMGTWSNERSNGTQELLFTLPARDSELLLGKYLAALGIYTVSLLFLLALAIGLSVLGSPDWGLLFANYLGFFLLGALLLSVSMLGSQLTDNMTVSLIVGGLCSAFVVGSGSLLQMLGAGVGVYANGPRGQFEDFGRGMVTSGGLLLFVGLTVAFLYCNLALLARRHHIRGGNEGLHRSVRFVALAVAAAALAVIGVNQLPRLDSTVEGIHSLSDESRDLLAQLDEKKPVFVSAYVSPEVPANLLQQKRALLNLIDQFDHLGGAAVEQRVVLTEPFSPEAQDAEKNFKITGRRAMLDEGGVSVESIVFLGFAVQCGTEEVVVPFVDAAVPLEYELMRSIRVAAGQARKTIGVLKTDVELYGGFDFQNFSQKPRWQIVEELLLQYKVENVEPDSEYPATLDALVVPQPSSLSKEQMDRLQAWILAGNAALLMEDPAPLEAPGTAATDQKGGPRAAMMGGGGPQKDLAAFANFLGSFGVRMPIGQVVWDLSYRTFAGGGLPPEFVFVDPRGYAVSEPVTKGLDRTVVLFGGHFQPQAIEGFEFSPLLRSVQPDPTNEEMNGTVATSDLFAFNPFGGGQQINPRRVNRPRPADYVLAARVNGPEKDGKRPRVVVLGDLDLVSNQFFELRRAAEDPNLR